MTGRHLVIVGSVLLALAAAPGQASAEWLYQPNPAEEPGHTTFTDDTTGFGALSFSCDAANGGQTWLAIPPQNYAEISTLSGPVPSSDFLLQVDDDVPITVRFGTQKDGLMRAPVPPAGEIITELVSGRQVTMRSPTGLTMRFSLRGSKAAIGKVLAACRADGAFSGTNGRSLAPAARDAMQSKAPVSRAPHVCFCCIKGHRVCE